MRYCESCKADYADEEKFCDECGSRLVEKAKPEVKSFPQLRCPSCNSEIAPSKKFCRHCGAVIEPTPAQQPCSVPTKSLAVIAATSRSTLVEACYFFLLCVFAATGVAIYVRLYLPYFFGDPTLAGVAASGWLKLHVLLYVVSYGLLLGAFILSILIIVQKQATRFPQVQAATCFATVLMAIAFVAGEISARAMWGLGVFSLAFRDFKFSAATMSIIVQVAITPAIVWLASASTRPSRSVLITTLLGVSIAFCFLSLILSHVLRSQHPQIWYLFWRSGGQAIRL